MGMAAISWSYDQNILYKFWLTYHKKSSHDINSPMSLWLSWAKFGCLYVMGKYIKSMEQNPVYGPEEVKVFKYASQFSFKFIIFSLNCEESCNKLLKVH